MQNVNECILKTPFKERFIKFFKSKLVVLAAFITLCVGMFGTIGQSHADDLDLSQVYQYFLLENKNGFHDKDDDGGLKNPVGILGSGGNHGDFSYSDIVEGAGKNNKKAAETFSAIMSTMSGYHYFSISSQGISGFLAPIGHALEGLLLIPFGLVIDISGLIYYVFTNIVTKFNVFLLLGNLLGQSSAGSDIAKAFGISQSTLTDFLSLGLSVFAIVIVLSLAKILSKSDAFSFSNWKKVLQRLLGFVAMPIAISICGLLLTDLMPSNDNSSVKQESPDFANYLIDVKTWAEKDNFDASVGNLKSINTKAQNGVYLDPEYNPYKGDAASSIGQQLYREGPLYGTAFPNTALAMQLLTNNTFNASDYLSYIQSSNGWNSVSTALSGFSKNNYAALYNFGGKDDGRTSTGAKRNWTNQPMDAAKSDYVSDKDHTQGPERTWIDRYIYGAKSSGDLKGYYGKTPSKEQIYAGFGGNHNGSSLCLSDASMYLALNTRFNVKGGTFSLNTPTRGVKGTMASFAYQTPVWSSISVVGNPAYTLPKMLSSSIFTLIVMLAILEVVFSVAIVDMNVSPLRAWSKSVFKGDLEYLYASIIYALGIVGTIVMVEYIAPTLGGFLNTVVSTVFTPLTQGLTFNSGSNINTSVGGTELIGISSWVTFIAAGVALYMFIKRPKFREGLKQFLIMPWTIAKEKGSKLESMADGENVTELANKNIDKNLNSKKKRREKNRATLDNLATNGSLGARTLNKITGGLAGKTARGINATKDMIDPNSDVDAEGGLNKKDAILRQMALDGAKQRLENDLAKMPNDHRIEDRVDEDLDKLEEQPFDVDENGMLNVDDPRLSPEQKEEAEAINAEQEILNEEQEQLDREREELERQHDNGEISDEEYEKRKAELEKRQAEHDQKQLALNQRRNRLKDEVNGTATPDDNGKFDLDNPNLNDEQREKAKVINDEQDEINEQQSASVAEEQAIDKEAQKIAKDQEQIDRDRQEYETHKANMTPEQRKQARSDLMQRQNAINERKQELDKRRKDLEEQREQIARHQESLDVRKQNLMNDVKNNNRELKKHGAVALAEKVRIAGASYEKNPNAQNATSLINTLQDMEQKATQLGTTTKQLYGFDAKKRIRDLQKATPVPTQASQQVMEFSEGDNGEIIATTQSLSDRTQKNRHSSVATQSKYSSTRKLTNKTVTGLHKKADLNAKTPSYKRANKYSQINSTKKTKSKYTKKH